MVIKYIKLLQIWYRLLFKIKTKSIVKDLYIRLPAFVLDMGQNISKLMDPPRPTEV